MCRYAGKSVVYGIVCGSLIAAFSAAGFAAEAPTAIPDRAAEAQRGTLFICGGGFLSDALLEEFAGMLGGEKGHLVVITTANWRADVAPHEVLELWRPWMKGKITLLHTHSRETADQEEFAAPLRTATGVWLMSGKQSRLTDAYLDTALLRELQAFVRRGGVVGGTSAGAAAMSDVMICGGTLTEPNIYPGLALLRDSIIDQHFLVRKREPRLLLAMQRHPGRVGFGIDEGTALIVRGRDIRVAGDSSVSVYLPASSNRPVHSFVLKPGDREDLQALRRAAIARSSDLLPAIAASPRVPQGSLVIVGGGPMPKTVQQKFIDLAGGPEAKIAVIPSAEEQAKITGGDVAWLKRAGAKNIVVVNPTTPDEANDPKLVNALREAQGVWFGGGRQWRLIDAFEKTAAYEAFLDVLRRGGVVGGTSAGATIQGEYLVRGSPLDNSVMMAEGYERGFAFLPGAAIDQHFSQRKRQADMERLKRTFPRLLGLGIDEATAVVVKGAKLEVLGEHTVSVYPPAVEEKTIVQVSTSTADEIVDSTAATPTLQPQVLKAGDAYDLERFCVEAIGR